MTVPLLPLYSVFFSFSSCFIHLTFPSPLCMYLYVETYIELIVIARTSPPGSYRISIIRGTRFKCIPLLKRKLLRRVLCIVHSLISIIGSSAQCSGKFLSVVWRHIISLHCCYWVCRQNCPVCKYINLQTYILFRITGFAVFVHRSEF
jgi:hypothetical protein